MVNGNENAMISIVARKRAEDAIEKQFTWCRKKRRSGELWETTRNRRQ